MGYVKLSAPPTIGNVAQNTGQFSTVGVGAAASTSGLYVNVPNRIGAWITGTNASSTTDADGLFIDASFAPSVNITNAAEIGLFPTFNPPGGVTISNGYGLYIAAGTQGGAGSVTNGYGLFVTAPAFGTSNFAASIGGLVINSAGTGTITTGVWNGTAIDVAHGGTGATTLTAHSVLIGNGNSTISQIGPVASTGNVLMSNGVSADPGFSTATYPVTTTINQVLYSSSNNVIAGITAANNGTLISGATGIPSWLANGTTGQLLTATTGSPPSWVSPGTATISITGDSGGSLSSSSFTFTGGTTGLSFGGSGSTETLSGVLVGANGGTGANNTTTTTGTILRSNGTAFVPTSATYPTTTTVSQILYSSATNAISGLATVNSSVLVTDSGGVPSLSSTLPAFTTSSITFNPTTGGIVGTTTNDNAAAGKVGEFISSSVTAVAITNSTTTDITSISLTAGDWDVWGTIATNPAGGTTTSAVLGTIHTVSATIPAVPNGGAYVLEQGFVIAAGNNVCYPIGTIRYSFSTTTTVYLIGFIAYAVSTLTASGFIGARRRR